MQSAKKSTTQKGFFSFQASSLAVISEDCPPLVDLTWFLVAFSAYAHFTCRFVSTLESVSDSSLLGVGLILFGLQWSVARLYSILLAGLVANWRDR